MAQISICLPVYNEAEILKENVEKVYEEVSKYFDSFEIVIADNGSTDDTLEIAKKLANKNSKIHTIHLDQQGRGRAIKRAWSQSKGKIVSYMDIDLSTDIKYFPELIKPITEDDYDISLGSRLLKESIVNGRTLLREIFSRGYNLLIKFIFFVGA